MFKFLLLFPFFVLPAKSQTSKTEEALSLAGYVNVRELDPTLQVSLMYARADNFVGVVLYDDLRQAYLHPDAAAALAKATKTVAPRIKSENIRCCTPHAHSAKDVEQGEEHADETIRE